ncbi:MAG: hypothetical protein R3C11_24700 [Planctomycetaceae bacterium]
MIRFRVDCSSKLLNNNLPATAVFREILTGRIGENGAGGRGGKVSVKGA